MAEVGQRLGSGVYRLSALRNGQSRPVCSGESPGFLLVTCTVTDSRISALHQRHVHPLSKSRATRRKSEKLSRVRTGEGGQVNGTSASLDPDSSSFIGFVQTRESLQDYKTALYLSSTRLQPLMQEKLLPVRMTPWTRGDVSIHPVRMTPWTRGDVSIHPVRMTPWTRGDVSIHPVRMTPWTRGDVSIHPVRMTPWTRGAVSIHPVRMTPWTREDVSIHPVRMTPWTRGAVSIHSDAFRSPQQLRAFCTVIIILAEQGSERPGCGLRRLKLHLDTLYSCTTTRSYSWRGDRSTRDALLLYRSRTAYYDILKVTPSATQTQIKTAYYKQSFIYHPDKNPGSKEATQRFSEISEAYTVLGNISLRRKYDRGILSQSDIQSAGRPSSKEAPSKSTGSPQQQQHQQQRARRFSQAGGKPMFDFDAFYQAHYGEQLQRERDMRARKQRMQEKQKENSSKWREGKIMEVTVATLLFTAGFIFFNLSRP